MLAGAEPRDGVQLVVIGASLGGFHAIEEVLAHIPEAFQTPIAFVQHRSADHPDTLARLLRRFTSLPVREPDNGEPIRAGHFYLAPADYHLIVERGEFALSTDRVVNYARPSIDVLFESAADAYGADLIGVILTGANRDGAAGARRIKLSGGRIIAQDPATAECAVMPKAAIDDANPDAVLELRYIGGKLAEWCA
jgi:two-component system, chemotaxis family, protein-glutamate methylesterase/glutaminase